MSKTKSIHHIVFATKHRELTITEEYKKSLYAYILGIVKNRKCYLLRINGIANHIHMLVDIHPSVALADLVRDVKQWSSAWLMQDSRFPKFKGWCEGYYAVSVNVEGIDSCRQYIINQEKYHFGSDLMNEMRDMAEVNRMDWHEEDWR